MADQPAPPSSSGKFFSVVLLVAALAVLFILVINRGVREERPVALAEPVPAPRIEADGWVNGEPEDLDGKFVVVDAWATWCGPCRAAAPHLVALHQKYEKQGVAFIGLTDEDESVLPEIREFLESTGVTWPNGYGAQKTLAALKAFGIPHNWIIDPDGMILWEGHPADLDSALEQALAKSR